MSVYISIVVCTYNRAPLLAEAMQTLTEQSVAPSSYEIIVVDNNSSDDTHSVVTEFCRRYPNVRYCFEPRQGVAHARNRGWKEARGEYVGYLDDDCIAPKEWLAVAAEVIKQYSPGVLGGPVLPRYDTPKPPWYEDIYIALDWGDQARALSGKILSAQNLFVRRALLSEVGGFDPNLGHRGEARAFGEETSLQMSIRATMPEQIIYYDPRLCVNHMIQAEHMALRWLARERFARGRYHAHRKGKSEHLGQLSLLRRAVLTLVSIGAVVVSGVLLRNRKKDPYFLGYVYKHAHEHVKTLGIIYEQFSCRTSIV